MRLDGRYNGPNPPVFAPRTPSVRIIRVLFCYEMNKTTKDTKFTKKTR